MSVWRRPGELSDDLYPGLSVWDDRVSGSITLKDSRLPLWAISSTAILLGWDRVEAGWSPTERYGYTVEDFAQLINNLLEMRGEFGRLLLMLANAERIERERADEHFAQQTPDGGDGEVGIFNMSLEDDDGLTPWPDSWWEMADVVEPLKEQLRRCQEALA